MGNGTNQYSKLPLAERFWRKVNKHGPIVQLQLGPCWLWTGATDDGGYGSVMAEGKNQKAHRVSWFLEMGKWPKPNALHKCDNTLCVRFTHLFEGTAKDNAQDTRAKERGTAKLTLKAVKSIRKALISGVLGKTLAKLHRVSPQTISHVKTGQCWKGII